MNTPTIGLFPHPYHYPVQFALPREQQLCIVPRDLTIDWNVNARIGYNIVHCDGNEIKANFGSSYVKAMLSPPRYLKNGTIAPDAQLNKQFVFDFERGYPGALSSYVGRHKSFDHLLLLMAHRFTNPVIVETGCIRCQEDWRGAGYGSYLLGAYVERSGGEMHSVDISKENCDFARKATTELSRLAIHTSDSIKFLREFDKAIDVLYLDSTDTIDPNHADHALEELLSALPKLHAQSVVLIDDTVYHAGSWAGKGSKGVPALLDLGWQVVYSGYQTLLEQSQSKVMLRNANINTG